MLLISQLKVNSKYDNIDLTKTILRKLRIQEEMLLGYTIQRRSIDARRKEEIYFVYNILAKVKGEKSILTKKIPNVQKHVFNNKRINHADFTYDATQKVPIIGFGPAGMFGALTLAQAGVNVTVFERGEEVDKRIKTIDK